MDFRHLIVTCLFSKLRLPFDNQKVKENYAIFFMKYGYLSFLFHCFYCLIFHGINSHINFMTAASNGVKYSFLYPSVQFIQRFVL